MPIDLLGIPQKEWDSTSSVKLWLRQNHYADDSRVKQKKVKVFNETQAVNWKNL